jgi:hypothetical protein
LTDVKCDASVELERWNAEAELWPAKAQLAQARLRAQCDRQMGALRDIRQRAEQHLRRILSSSSAAAWEDIERGTDRAWEELRSSFERAREEFENVARKDAA